MSPGGNWTFSFRLDPRVEPAALDHLLKDVARAGFHAIELPITSHGLMTPESPEPDCRALGERIRASDLSPATLSLDACDDLETHLAAPDEAHRRMACDRIVSVLDQTAWLGAGALVITPARVGRPVDPTPAISYESAYAYALEALLELRFKAARRAVRIACRVAANRFLPS
ncbi:MAG: TIM barrel protein, partial [Phycisphaerae bacterium]